MVSTSVAFEVYYPPPADDAREFRLRERIAQLGGAHTFREDATELSGVCLTFEFATRSAAESAADDLRRSGEHVEGPFDYGDATSTI